MANAAVPSVIDARTGGVTIEYAQPPADLSAHLSVFYEQQSSLPEFGDVDRADLAQFRVMCTGHGEYRFADGHVSPAPAVAIVGPTTGPTRLTLWGPAHIVGVGLLPAGWATLLDFEASLLVNRTIDAIDLFGDAVRGAPEAMCAADSFGERVRLGCALARKLIDHGQTAVFEFTRIVDAWLASRPSPDLAELVRATGLSRRQVERRCNACYGSPPKLLARKYRALKAAIALAKGDATAADLLADGFYDQSHLIREIKAFTGLTPTGIADDLPTLASLTLKRAAFVEPSRLERSP